MKSPSAKKNNDSVKALTLPKPLTAEQTYRSCPITNFSFKTTKTLKSSHDIIAQNRAIEAINMGLGIRRPGYNIYVAGILGTGKTSVIRQFLEKWSKNAPLPNDWVYVYDFNSVETPKAIELKRGEGKKFKRKMEQLVKSFKSEIPSALQSEDYENTVNSYLSSTNERKSKLYSELEKHAKSMGFSIKSSRIGIETVPIVDGRPLTEKEYNKLSDNTKNQIESQRAKLEPEVLDFARKVRGIDQEIREYIETLRKEMGDQIISGLMAPLIEDYSAEVQITEYLLQVKENIVENLLDFIEDDDKESNDHYAVNDSNRFAKYKINVFVDNHATKSAPVIIESNPTYYNLFGKIEKNVEHGMYRTDLTMIKSGSIHRANGGYLVLNALDVFRTNSIWETLKRILRTRQGFIEDMGEQYSLLPTSGLRPAPIPLDLKVILIGNEEIYHILYQGDEEFQKIFKIKADFDFKMERTAKNIKSYISFVATRSNLEDLLPFDRSGVAAVVEFSSRLVEDQKQLSTQFGEIKDLTIEADYVARENGAKVIKREDVEAALNRKYFRLNMHEENLLQMIQSGDFIIAVDGAKIGQINCLAVYDYGDYAFGKIGRITCTTSISDSGIINIERASHLSGNIHDKGVYILSGYLHALLAREKRLGLAASVCFEQSYGIIDGDSASCAELIAILSAMAEIPIKQNFAITGSVNQMGEVQTIGGLNEKIEGFHKTSKLIGKSKQYTVVIPKQNIHNLMLHADVRESIKAGTFHIIPVTYVWEAFQLMTGVALGVKDIHSKAKFTKGSALAIIREKLDKLAEEVDESQKEKRKSKYVSDKITAKSTKKSCGRLADTRSAKKGD